MVVSHGGRSRPGSLGMATVGLQKGHACEKVERMVATVSRRVPSPRLLAHLCFRITSER